MELNEQNYYDQPNSMKYISFSQIKDFLKCEYHALKKAKGEIVEETTEAMLIGSYVDAHYEGSEAERNFLNKHPEMFNKQGALLKKYEIATKMINAIDNDELFKKCVTQGEHQKIMVGAIDNCPIKIRMDNYVAGKYIFDLKTARDTQIWIEVNGRNKLENFVVANDYLLQLALYREIVRQNTGANLSCVICVVTKTSTPKKYLLELDSADLDRRLEEIRPYIKRIQDIKEGKVEPRKCGKCDTCLGEEKVTGIFSYHILDPKRYDDNDVEF